MCRREVCSRVAAMGRESETLRVGDRAPDFTLAPANQPGTVSLPELIRSGPAVLEFLRGTW